MLRFLSSLFSSAPEAGTGPDEALIEKAIERVVSGTDQRLRAMGRYRQALWSPVERAVTHVISLVDILPEPIPISPSAFGTDPRLRTVFASGEHMVEVIGRFRSARDYLSGSPEAVPERIFGLLTMVKDERTVLGMELEGEMLRRDVIQVALNFSNHRYLCPTGSESDTRRELKIRAFDYLVERALERLVEERGKRRDLERQRHLLKQKLAAMRAGSWGLGEMLDGSGDEPPDLKALEAEIEAIDGEFGQFRTSDLQLEESLACVAEVIGRPADWLAVRDIPLLVDARGIKVSDPHASAAMNVVLPELYSCTGQQRTVLLGYIAEGEIPRTDDFWLRAKRYL